MGELISRHAAVSEVRNVFEEHRGLSLVDVLTALLELPYTEDRKWVTGKTPKDNCYVLVTYGHECGRPDIGIEYARNGKWNCNRPVVAWMPLPEVYRREQ